MYISSGIHNPNHCNQFLYLIGDIENSIIINRHNSCISTLPGLSFINKTLSFAIGGNPLPLGGGRSLVNL